MAWGDPHLFRAVVVQAFRPAVARLTPLAPHIDPYVSSVSRVEDASGALRVPCPGRPANRAAASVQPLDREMVACALLTAARRD